MLNCKEVTKLMSQDMDKKLSIGQCISLRFHLMMCGGCRNFDRQMEFLRDSFREYTKRNS